jgi:hypothetical protein
MNRVKVLFLGFFLLLSIEGVFSSRDFSFLEKEGTVTVGEKKFGEFHDKVFKDIHGREIIYRGWNLSNGAKNPENGFRGYKSQEELVKILKRVRRRTGSNIIRWLTFWEAVNPAVDVIDKAYLRELVKGLKVAIGMKFFILLDWHQDLFSRACLDSGGGNGTPPWVVEGMGISSVDCKVCKIWSLNYFFNPGVRKALQHFWENGIIDTRSGLRYPQDEFIWHMKRALKFIREQLTPQEFSYIVGVDPWNEPFSGGLKNLGLSPQEFHHEKLWPFYQNIRKMMNSIGYRKTLLFAEPSMIWNINLPFVTPRGGDYMKEKVEGYVFNAHFYDEIREGIPFLGRVVQNGAYLKELDRFRMHGRNLGVPTFVSEFGAWGDNRVYDSNRVLKATFQGFEVSKTSKRRMRTTDFYSPVLSSTQWDNGFVKEEGYGGDIASLVVERAFPRRSQGDVMSFYYNDGVQSSYDQKDLKWAGLRYKKKVYFEDQKFFWMVWRGRNSEAPTEIFLPKHFDLKKTLLMTEKKMIRGLEKKITFSPSKLNEVLLRKDLEGDENSGTRIFLFDDREPKESEETFHFVLIAEEGDQRSSDSELETLQKGLVKKLFRKESPLYLLGKMVIDRPKKARPFAK